MPEQLRVAVDATSLYDVRTGVGRFTQEVLTEAGRRPDLDVSAFAITARGRGRLSDLVPAGVHAAEQRMPLPARPLRTMWCRGDHPRIDGLIGRPQVVHGPNFVVPPTKAGAVVTIHDLTYLRFPEMCTRDVLQYRQLVPRALGRGALVHTVSEFVRQEVLDQYRIDPDRVVAIHNGATRGEVGDAGAGRADVGAERYLLALGTVEPRKDLPGLVRAFAGVAAVDPDVRLVIAGADGWGAEALTEAIRVAAHRDRVVRTGWIADSRRADLLAGAVALVQPSAYEGFGLPVLEAMAAGTPVVATDVGAIPEVAGGAARLVPGGDPDALGQALLAVTGDEDLQGDLRRRGLERATQFSWATCVEGLTGLWRRAADAG